MARLSQTIRKCTVIMLLCYYLLVLFLMNRNMRRRTSGNQNSYGFFFQGDTKGTNPTVFLCSIPLHQIHEKQYQRKLQFRCFSFTFPFKHCRFQQAGLSKENPTLKKCFCATSILWTQATAILAQLPGPSTNAQLKRAEINNDGVQESPSRIAKLPGTSLLVIQQDKIIVFPVTTSAQWTIYI